MSLQLAGSRKYTLALITLVGLLVLCFCVLFAHASLFLAALPLLLGAIATTLAFYQGSNLAHRYIEKKG